MKDQPGCSLFPRLDLVVSLVSLLVVRTGGWLEEKNPPVAQVPVLRVVAHIGEDVRISCPVEGKPAPYIEWTREGEIIDYSWSKYKTHRKFLKIKNVVKEDAGILFCKAINGFGSTQVRIELYVSDEENTKEVAPIFTDETLNLNTLYKKMVGESFSIDCAAMGIPPPNISWVFDTTTVSGTGRLEMTRLREEQSGVYTCLAASLAGQATRQFFLTVETPHVEKPVIKHTTNTTVYQGQMVELDCLVESRLKPDIQWLQENEGEEYSIKLGEMKLINAGVSEIKHLGSDKYQSSLIVQQADQSQVYVCLVTNPAGGFTYMKSYLQVLPTLYLEILPMVLMILGGTVILLMVVVTGLVRSRQKLISQYHTSTYSSHVYDVPHYSPVSLTDTVSTPLSVRQSKVNSPRNLTYNRSLQPYMEPKQHWEFMKDSPEYCDLKLI